MLGSMLGRKEMSRWKKHRAGEGGHGTGAFNAAAITTTITTADGQVLTMSEFISRFDEAAKRRLEIMNQKLRDMEMQMEALEAEMSKFNDPSTSNWT